MLRMRLYAQPQVRRELRNLARRRSVDPRAYRSELERLAQKLRGFTPIGELAEKVSKLADPDYPDDLVWGIVWGIGAAERDSRERQRAPRQTGALFRVVVAVY